ncbi:MAG: cytochrome c-type biogenesis protein CcmH [Thermomicrobiales bacterium]
MSGLPGPDGGGQPLPASHPKCIGAQVKAAGPTKRSTTTRARYGDEVLVEPPHEGINLALWWLPVGAVVLDSASSRSISAIA